MISPGHHAAAAAFEREAREKRIETLRQGGGEVPAGAEADAGAWASIALWLARGYGEDGVSFADMAAAARRAKAHLAGLAADPAQRARAEAVAAIAAAAAWYADLNAALRARAAARKEAA